MTLVTGARRALRATSAWAVIGVLLAGCDAADPDQRQLAADPAGADRPDVTLVTDSRNDCGACTPGPRLDGVAVASADGGSDVVVRLATAPEPGDQVWLWFELEPAHPVLLERVAGGWRLDVPEAAPFASDDIQLRHDATDVVIHLRGMGDEDAVAVVSAGGDRIPARGYVDAAGAEATAGGAVATRVADAVASVQSGFPGLDPHQQALARLTLARQLTPGTFRYALAFADRPDLNLVAEISVRFPELAQHLYVEIDGDPVLAQSVFVLSDGITSCTWMTDGSADCAPGELPLPVTGLAGMIEDPRSVVVEPVSARAVLDEAAGCWSVVTSAEDGPPEGESCALADGALAVNDNLRSGHRLVLVERTATVRDAAFVVP